MMSTNNIFTATYFMPIIHYVHSEKKKMRQDYLLYVLHLINSRV